LKKASAKTPVVLKLQAREIIFKHRNDF